MPPEHIKDKERWEKAKEIVQEEYGKTPGDGDEFYELVMGVYKQARGTIQKKDRVYYHHRRDGDERKRTVEEGTEAPRSRLQKSGRKELIKAMKYYGKDELTPEELFEFCRLPDHYIQLG